MTCLRWGLQNKVESFIQGTEKRIFTNFHREVRPILLICAKCVPMNSDPYVRALGVLLDGQVAWDDHGRHQGVGGGDQGQVGRRKK